jgi:hypothetical protein
MTVTEKVEASDDSGDDVQWS